MPINNGYATMAEFKARYEVTGVNAVRDNIIEQTIYAVSRLIDNYCGGRTFYPRTETRYYDTPENSQQLDIGDDDLLTVSVSGLVNGERLHNPGDSLYLTATQLIA